MKKLREARNTVQQAEALIEGLKEELCLTRNLLYRMYLKHGAEYQGGHVKCPDTVNFSIGDDVAMWVSDLTGEFPTSRYADLMRRFGEL